MILLYSFINNYERAINSKKKKLYFLIQNTFTTSNFKIFEVNKDRR